MVLTLLVDFIIYLYAGVDHVLVYGWTGFINVYMSTDTDYVLVQYMVGPI